MTADKPEWASQTAFIFAASAAAIGLGNIWRFPYLVGENGGGVFVITYLICVVLLALPLLLSEIIIGRIGQQNPMASFINTAQRSKHSRLWGIVGFLSIITGFLIMTYYVVIGGWVADYTLRAIQGQFAHATQQTSQLAFRQLQNNPYEMLAATSFVVFVSFAINVLGIKNGIERAVRVMFSAYLPRKVSSTTAAFSIAIADTGFALLAGLIIFPIVFAHHMQPSAGPSLIFQTLPIAFGNMKGGSIVAALFFFMLFFAAFSSIISVLEPAICWLIETFKLKRLRAVTIVMIACWLVSLLSIGSFSHKELFLISDKTYFQHIDFITAGICLPLAGLFTALFCGWALHKQLIQQYLHWPSHGRWYKLWEGLLRYFAPLAIILILLTSI